MSMVSFHHQSFCLSWSTAKLVTKLFSILLRSRMLATSINLLFSFTFRNKMSVNVDPTSDCVAYLLHLIFDTIQRLLGTVCFVVIVMNTHITCITLATTQNPQTPFGLDALFLSPSNLTVGVIRATVFNSTGSNYLIS